MGELLELELEELTLRNRHGSHELVHHLSSVMCSLLCSVATSHYRRELTIELDGCCMLSTLNKAYAHEVLHDRDGEGREIGWWVECICVNKRLLEGREGQGEQLRQSSKSWLGWTQCVNYKGMHMEAGILTGETPVEDLVDETLTRVAAFGERTLVCPSFHEARFCERNGVRVNVFRLGQQGLRSANEHPNESVGVCGMGECLKDLGRIVSVDASVAENGYGPLQSVSSSLLDNLRQTPEF